MPGHVKKTSGPDPDPSPWLEVKDHIREEQKKKAYDPKKSVWVPNADKEVGGYFEGICAEEIKYDTFTAGKKLSVTVNGEVKTYKADTVCQVNPAKFDCSEDMADLTFLGDACVLWNSVVRYKNELGSDAIGEAAKKDRSEKKSQGAFKCGAGCGSHGTKRCTGCYLVFFCSEACFKKTWPAHKQKCKETRAQYKTVDLTVDLGVSLNFRSKQMTMTLGVNTTSKKHFVVKVQMPGIPNKPLMVYNEDRSMHGMLEKASAPQVYDTLVASIDNHGVKGLKGFFYAINKKENASSPMSMVRTVEINPEVILPPEKW